MGPPTSNDGVEMDRWSSEGPAEGHESQWIAESDRIAQVRESVHDLLHSSIVFRNPVIPDTNGHPASNLKHPEPEKRRSTMRSVTVPRAPPWYLSEL